MCDWLWLFWCSPCVPALSSWFYLFYSCDKGSDASSQSCADTPYGSLDGLLYNHGELDSEVCTVPTSHRLSRVATCLLLYLTASLNSPGLMTSCGTQSTRSSISYCCRQSDPNQLTAPSAPQPPDALDAAWGGDLMDSGISGDLSAVCDSVWLNTHLLVLSAAALVF